LTNQQIIMGNFEVEQDESDVNKKLLAYMSQAFNVSRGQEKTAHDDDDDDDDDSSSVGSQASAGSFFTSHSGESGETEPIDEDNKILEEGLIVRKSKVIIFFSIVLVAIAGAVTTTFLVRREENDVASEHLYGFSHEIASKSQANLEQAFTAVRTLSRTIASAAAAGEEDFPFVTLPHFEVFGGEAREMANAEVVAFVPLVSSSDLEAWEIYAQKHQGWISEGLKHEGFTTTDPGRIPERLHIRSDNPHGHVDAGAAEVHLPGYHFPVWQMSSAPRNASIVNLDLSADNSLWEHNIVDVIHRRKPLLSSVQDLQYLTQFSVSEDEHSANSNANVSTLAIDILNPLALSEQPTQSYILQPIFGSVEAYFSSPSFVVGFVVAVMDWKSLFSDILPSGINGINVVVKDGCGYAMTYVINGPEAVFLGEGDLHGSKYDSYLLTVNDFGGLAAAGFEDASELHPEVNGTTYDQRFEGTERGHCEVSGVFAMPGPLWCASIIF
jgi:hypothetical protein